MRAVGEHRGHLSHENGPWCWPKSNTWDGHHRMDPCDTGQDIQGISAPLGRTFTGSSLGQGKVSLPMREVWNYVVLVDPMTV